MRIFALIVLCSIMNGYYAEESTESTSDSPIVISETVISKEDDGYCTFDVRKRKIVVVEMAYMDVETYYGRCPRYYFKKCLMERPIMRKRSENQVREFNETVKKCCDGYVNNEQNNKCLPICEHNCVFSSCTAPNVCTCYKGYSSTDKTHVCQPNCAGCTHGICFAPNICTCNSGYNWDSSIKECVPVCVGMCHNGKCISPEQCDCNPGYIHHPTHSVCIPHCNETCVNGVCRGPNECECNFGYHFKNGSQIQCEPICNDLCKNAQCVEPNVCECENGYSKLDKSKPHECHCGPYCVEIDNKCHCLDDDHRFSGDVIRNNMSIICTEKTCQNGICISNYECECFDGFGKDENFNCVAVNDTCIDDSNNCKGNELKPCNCVNGICASNNTCFCVNGFKFSEGHRDICEPACSEECINGYCINPNQCECNTGYRLGYNESQLHICHPICDPDIEEENGCVNGTCVAPGTCECFSGFKFSNESNFTCVYDPLFAQRSKFDKILHWITPAIVVTAFIVATLFGISYFINKRKIRSYDSNKSYDEANVPIAGYGNDDL